MPKNIYREKERAGGSGGGGGGGGEVTRCMHVLHFIAIAPTYLRPCVHRRSIFRQYRRPIAPLFFAHQARYSTNVSLTRTSSFLVPHLRTLRTTALFCGLSRVYVCFWVVAYNHVSQQINIPLCVSYYIEFLSFFLQKKDVFIHQRI